MTKANTTVIEGWHFSIEGWGGLAVRGDGGTVCVEGFGGLR